MPLIIDTYNVLHVTGVLPPELAVGEPDGLARLVAQSRYASDVVWLICDGVPRGASRVGRILIEGAGPGRSADDHIKGFLDRTSAPRQVTVVTSDRAIQRHARSRGADWMTSEDFLASLVGDVRRARPKRALPPDPRRSVPLAEREVHGWMRLFGITAEMAAIKRAEPSRDGDTAKGATEASNARTKSEATRGSTRDHSTPTARRTKAPATRSHSDDAALERFLAATKGLADPLAILDEKRGDTLLAELGALDDATLESLMKAHEPPVLKDGARIGGRQRKRREKRSES